MLCAQVVHTDCMTDSMHILQDVTVTARRLPAAVTAGKPVQIIGKEELDELGITNIADAVKKFAGVNVRDYGGIGGMKTVSVRNLGAHHTAVSYDGITISNTQAGQIDIGRYHTDNVSSLSLAVGDNDDLMQTARHYASAGVLSIVTERPHFEAGKDYVLRLIAKGGSFGMASPSLRYWQKLGESTSASLDATYMRADGMYPFTLVNGNDRTREKRINSDIYSWQGEANMYHTFRDSSSFDVKASWFYSQRGVPGAVILYNNNADDRLWDEDFFVQANYRKMINRKWQLAARMKYVHSWNRYEATNQTYDNGIQLDVNRQNEYYMSLTAGWTPVRNLSVALAQDVVYGNLRNNIYINTNSDVPNPERITALTALALRFAPHRWVISGNVVWTFVAEHVSTGAKPDDRKRMSPSLSVSYRLLDNDALYIRAMMKNTFRVPSFNDLYYRRIGNTSLKPEKANEISVGITWNCRPVGAMRYLSVTADGYWNNTTDKIVAFPGAYIWRMANFGKARIHGVDITLATDIALAHRTSIVLNAAYTLQKSVDNDSKSATYGNRLPYTPDSNGNISAILRNPWVNVGYSVSMCGMRYSMGQNKPEYEIGGYSEHTLTLSRIIDMAWGRIELRGSVVNLTDRQYEVIKYYPMPGRTYNVSMTITL